MSDDSININKKFELFNDHWSPKGISQFDNYAIKAVKLEGQFTWHTHADCDEVFIVNKGQMVIEFRDRQVEVNQGEIYVVEMGIEHRPFAQEECETLIIERNDVLNTGNVKNEFTKETINWI